MAEEKKVREEGVVEKMRTVEAIFSHPLRDLFSPGAGHKLEAGFSAGGRIGLGYLGYLAGKWGLTKIKK